MSKINMALNRRHFALGSAAALLAANIGAAKAAGLLEEIKKRGKIVVATEAAFEPFEFVLDGKIVGYNMDILAAVIDALGVPMEQLNLPYQGILPGLLAKKFDLVATSNGINEERIKKYAYTRPTGSYETVIVVRHDDDRVKTLDDLNGLVVASQLASSVQPILEAHNAELKAKGGAGYAELKLFTAFPEVHIALASGQVDAIAIASPSAAVLMKNVPDTYKVATQIGQSDYLCWLTRPEDIDLRDFINAKIDELNDSGKLKELQMKWFGFEMKTPKDGYLPAGAF
jgi:polar amino acid transport system substrate-binding protein